MPLNLTDMVVGDDGALYFTCGGRNTQGYLFRVTYAGPASTAPADLHDAQGADEPASATSLNPITTMPTRRPSTSHGRTWAPGTDYSLCRAARHRGEPVAGWKSRALAERGDSQTHIERCWGWLARRQGIRG